MSVARQIYNILSLFPEWNSLGHKVIFVQWFIEVLCSVLGWNQKTLNFTTIGGGSIFLWLWRKLFSYNDGMHMCCFWQRGEAGGLM